MTCANALRASSLLLLRARLNMNCLATSAPTGSVKRISFMISSNNAILDLVDTFLLRRCSCTMSKSITSNSPCNEIIASTISALSSENMEGLSVSVTDSNTSLSNRL